MMNLKLARKKDKFKVNLIVEEREYVDMIFRIMPIDMMYGDTLQVTCKTKICGYTNKRKTSEIEEKWRFTFLVTKKILVKYIRFTRNKDKGHIQILKSKPKNYYNPKRYTAKKLRSKK